MITEQRLELIQKVMGGGIGVICPLCYNIVECDPDTATLDLEKKELCHKSCEDVHKKYIKN